MATSIAVDPALLGDAGLSGVKDEDIEMVPAVEETESNDLDDLFGDDDAEIVQHERFVLSLSK